MSLDKAFQNIVMLIDKAKLEPPPALSLETSIYLDPIFLFNGYMNLIKNIDSNIKTFNNAENLFFNSYKISTIFKDFNTAKNTDFVYDDINVVNFTGKLVDNFINLPKGATANITTKD